MLWQVCDQMEVSSRFECLQSQAVMGSEQPEHQRVFVCLKSIECLFRAGSLNAPGDSNVNSRYLTDTHRAAFSQVTSYTTHIWSPFCALA